MGISIPEGVKRCKPCYSRGIWAPIAENPVILGELENPYKTHTIRNKVIIGQYILNFAISIPSGDSE